MIKKAYGALSEGGSPVVLENIIDDNRAENAFGLMMSLFKLYTHCKVIAAKLVMVRSVAYLQAAGQIWAWRRELHRAGGYYAGGETSK